uniref:hypothetical protein n=1 Tax=Endozoicomonas sp. SESOKO2 TaxID=2828743 RepID=UPI002148A746
LASVPSNNRYTRQTKEIYVYLIALNILEADITSKRSIKTKRKKAGWSNKHLAQLPRAFVVGLNEND